MPALQIIRGNGEGSVVPLESERFILGRNPDCGIVIPVTSVSREHAQILRIQGRFYIEDKQSRNGTYVNNQAINARTLLKNNDKIRICDFLAAFLDNADRSPQDPEDAAEEGTTSTVEATLSHGSDLRLEQQPAEKLRALLEISGNLSKTLELGHLLPKIADSLFLLFRQADRCFLIQTEDDDGTKLMPRVVKTRRPNEESNARFSKAIVRNCLNTAQAFLSDDATKDDRVQLSQSVVDFRIRSVMCVPLCGAEGKAFGVIQLDTQDRSKKFTQDDLKLLWGVANQSAIALENARLHEETVRQEKLKRDLELAHEVQMSFLPRSLPELEGYQFGAVYQPALEVGGDYYGFIPLPEGKLAVVVGDVAGKGIAASLLMAKLSSDTRFSVLTEPDPGKAVMRLNDLLYEFTSQADKFVSLVLAVLDPHTDTVTLVSAGHASPLLYRPGQPLKELLTRRETGVLLGIMEGYPFESYTFPLAPGDVLLLYTDGVNEAIDVHGNQYGLKGMQASLQSAGILAPQALVDRLASAIQRHAAGRATAFDDVTMACLGRNR
jgi:serine phosphatase RsbU (regulator of sigma subunit)/pSer/pThr/pTyr-binding forkhead associated (FHA) protein